jgi:hypothetical protein
MGNGMADDPDSYAKGPLDDLVPGLRRKAERFAALPVHPRVVHARSPGGERTIVLASFAPAVSARAFHAALKPLVEATMLSELSRAASELEDEGEDQLAALELYAFAPSPFDARPALSPFGLTSAALDDAGAQRALALLRHETRLIDGAVSEEACARYRAPFARSAHPLAAPLASKLLAHAPKSAWGVEPGALARTCADQLAALGYDGVEPTRVGIEKLEQVVVATDHGVLRWMAPLLFQALCDLVAVAATVTYGRDVQWGVCEPDEEGGLAPPPVLRVERDGDTFHVPLGEHVLRWCVMPTVRGEEIPTLGAWTEHEFT